MLLKALRLPITELFSDGDVTSKIEATDTVETGDCEAMNERINIIHIERPVN